MIKKVDNENYKKVLTHYKSEINKSAQPGGTYQGTMFLILEVVNIMIDKEIERSQDDNISNTDIT